MDVSCPACAARYTANDEKLRGKTARMRCKACDTVWLVSGPPAAEALGASSAPSASKRAAVVRTGSERERRDLFAQREPDHGSIKQTLLPPPSLGLSSGVGARNENSVLFRVDQLAGAGRVRPQEPARAPAFESPAAPTTTDDEGVIDLKALASVPPRKIAMPVAPLFSEPPGMALDVAGTTAHVAARPASRLPLIGGLAAAAAFLLVAGFGISLAFQSEEPVKHTAAIVAPPPPPAVASADPKEESDEPKATKKGRGKKGRGKGRAAKSGPITNKTPAPAAKRVKAADPCHCKGDFNCILACTAKGGK